MTPSTSTSRPLCPCCHGTKVRGSIGSALRIYPCDCCRPDGTQRGVTDSDPGDEPLRFKGEQEGAA